jgi:hypothetical protein
MKLRNIAFLFVLALLFSCKPELEEISLSSGSADFSKYVAIGNSLTAGFADGALYRSGQENSYPAILAQQMLMCGGGEFKQPLMFDELGFGGRLLLDATIEQPVVAPGEPDALNFASIADRGPFNNLGVPGAKSFHLVPGAEAFSQMNPYYGRFASQPGVSTVLAEAKAQNPTFFTAWIGANDVLGYALEGGAADSITDPGLFQMALGALLQEMIANGAKGAVANIPDITAIPYFRFMNTRLPFNALVINEQQAAALNAAYAPLNALIKSLNSTDTIYFAAGPNPFVIADRDLPWGMRQMTANDLFLLRLPTDSISSHGWGSSVPIPNRHVLTTSEIQRIGNAIGSYNEIIMNLANQFDLAYVDINQFMFQTTSSGINRDGITFTGDFVTGNTFSLDGIHLTAKAYAMVANKFIEAINKKYNSNLKEVSPLYYPGIYLY